MMNKEIWLKKSKNNSNVLQFSVCDEKGEWNPFFCSKSEVLKMINGVFDMAKFTHITSIQNKGVKK